METKNESNDSLQTNDHNQEIVGGIILFYAYDVGDSIDLEKIHKSKKLKSTEARAFAHFKNYHIPLFVDLEKSILERKEERLSVRIHNFGVISCSYRIPFSGKIKTLKNNLLELVEKYKKIAQEDAKSIFDKVQEFVTEPVFYDLDSSYYAIQIDHKKSEINRSQIIKDYGVEITSLLRLEKQSMSVYQKEKILESTTGYYGTDLVIIDSEASLIYDSEYTEILDFLEVANIQKLELQCFDRLLDKKLNFFYGIDTYQVPIKSYIPLLGSRVDTLLDKLAKLKVDISVITERITNNVNMAGDAYYEDIYSMLKEKMKLEEWKKSIDEKLSIINEIYSIRKSHLETIREEMMMLVIILLIAFEATVAFLKH